jgi:hypothetical protein
MIKSWLNRMFPRERLMPDAEYVKAEEQLYLQIPERLIETWVERNLLSNPQSTDPNICIAWAARCDFIESIIKIRDRAANPAKYQQLEQPAKWQIEPRRVA